MTVENLTPVEAASVLLSTTFGFGYFDTRIENKLHLRRPRIEPSADIDHWNALFQDSQKSQLLVNTLNQVLECQAGIWPLNERRLDEQETMVLRLRYGLEDGQTNSFPAIGKRMGLGGERARQIDAVASQKLRSPGLRDTWKPFLPTR